MRRPPVFSREPAAIRLGGDGVLGGDPTARVPEGEPLGASTVKGGFAFGHRGGTRVAGGGGTVPRPISGCADKDASRQNGEGDMVDYGVRPLWTHAFASPITTTTEDDLLGHGWIVQFNTATSL
jgi:hypothetical protein